MSYYDNIKDSVKDDGGDGNEGGASFDTLKEEAEKTDVESDEEKGDGTPIEVLEEGGLREEAHSSGSQRSDSSGTSSESGSNPLTGGSSSGNGSQPSQDLSGLEQKLERIIEQNDEMIEILRSFGG